MVRLVPYDAIDYQPRPRSPLSRSQDPMTTRSRLFIAAALLAITLGSLAGCRSSNLSASALPPEMLAPHGAGTQRIGLQNMSLIGGRSSAIGPADLLEVTLVTGLSDEDTKPLSARVRDDGSVEIPYVGPVHLEGLEPTEAADQIARAAVERRVYLQPQVQVRVTEQATHRVTVLGAVADPGVQDVPRSGCDILAAVAAAGGFTEEAGTVVEVLRHAPPAVYAGDTPIDRDAVRPISFEAPVLQAGPIPERIEKIDLADAGATPLGFHRLGDRDVIVVRPKEKRLVHVSGLVRNPNQFELTEDHDLRVLDAVAMAGGVTTQVADKVLVIRKPEGQGEPVVVEVSIAKAKQDGQENLVLMSGDLISVEPTVATVVVETVNDVFRITLGVGGNLNLF